MPLYALNVKHRQCSGAALLLPRSRRGLLRRLRAFAASARAGAQTAARRARAHSHLCTAGREKEKMLVR